MDPQLQEFTEEFQRESDRSAAILGAAYLETRLEELLRAKFVSDAKMVKELFGQYGPLGSFSSKISVAYAAGFIREWAAVDLHVIRKVRNDFAHKLHGLTFETEHIRDRIAALKCLDMRQAPDIRGAGYPGIGHFLQTPRKQFAMAIGLIRWLGIEYQTDHVPRLQSPAPQHGGPMLFGDFTFP